MKQDLQSLTVLTVTFRKHLKPFAITIHFQVASVYSNTCYFIHLLSLLHPRICSGMLNVRNVLNHKVKLGLGTGKVICQAMLCIIVGNSFFAKALKIISYTCHLPISCQVQYSALYGFVCAICRCSRRLLSIHTRCYEKNS